MAAAKRPSFKRPPLGEVVCGVQFRPLALFQAPHYGLYWQAIRADFPTSRTVLPLGNSFQMVQNEPAEITVQLGAPDMPRVWFISADEACLIQVQQDRFLFNWRDGAGINEYPRYPTVIKRFKRLFAGFKDFLKKNEIGEPTLTGTEMSYINNIKPGEGWNQLSQVGTVFPDFSWREGARFLAPPDAFNFRSNHALPAGRLHVAIQTAKTKDNPQHIRFDLTARAALADIEDGDVWPWFDQANDSIVKAFIDLTAKSMQTNVWQRVN